MKNIHISIQNISRLFILIITLSSCSEDFLEVEVKGDFIATTTNEYDLLLNNIQLFSLESIDLDYAMSPEVCRIEPYNTSLLGLSKQPAFRWLPDIYEPEVQMPNVFGFTRHIYLYNKIINEVPNSVDGTESEKKRVEADARASRAWMYFQLINYFGKPYNPATASDDLGFPILTESDVTLTDFSRASVESVYNFMLDDLNKAIPYLSDLYHRTRMSNATARALLAKVHIFMGNYSEGLQELDEAFNLLQNSSLESGLYDYNITTQPGGIMQNFGFGPNEPVTIFNIENPLVKTSFNIDGGFFGELVISPEITALYGPTDIRLTNFFTSEAQVFSGLFLPPGFLRKQGKSNGYLGINIPDMYLLRAECKARTNDLSGAVEDVEFLRRHRMPIADAPIPTGLSQDDLIRYIVEEERIREFAVEGKEWFTTRRLSTDPLFSGKVYIHTLYDATGAPKETFTLTPERFVLKFNDNFMEQNPNIINNP
ncbi:RagB/SusD family nutrient uptake outer membrane protein [Flavivirga amylovorans]|uniref:RagB/SusD family nutrient uptake outer membrane protein n=1 Tax=Flavivirga amylovorans TaxID=870486 RepID=A0ABT8X4L5_9FLAO|nr:RagB/SusD family nutrient uptake outer membrane protein [Flavivirga amylovorans]MDO5988920.1 RagB/SusD family nutrient uptake outer membrane protein [Flavivirga amylovorans]